jgi:hypothetical protein
MEKIKVIIGRINSTSANAKRFDRKFDEDCKWLQDTLEISFKRARNLILKSEGNSGTTDTIIVILDYRQLARYTAKRQVDDLNRYWKFPHVLEFEEEPETPDVTVFELRAAYRGRNGIQ